MNKNKIIILSILLTFTITLMTVKTIKEYLPTEYNDGGAAGKFSSDVSIENQLLIAEYDQQMSK